MVLDKMVSVSVSYLLVVVEQGPFPWISALLCVFFFLRPKRGNRNDILKNLNECVQTRFRIRYGRCAIDLEVSIFVIGDNVKKTLYDKKVSVVKIRFVQALFLTSINNAQVSVF